MQKKPMSFLFFCLILIIPIDGFTTQEAYFKLKSLKELRMQGIKRQTKDYSCGAAALSILLKNYFEDKHEEQVILSDIVYRLSDKENLERMTEGFSMLDLKKSAQRLGYTADGVLLDQSAITALNGPVIILLRKKELKHFVVLKGATQGRAFIADPSQGHLRISLFELFSQWKGETLIIGREGFGLPKMHGLAIPKGNAAAPERELVRVLQHAPPP